MGDAVEAVRVGTILAHSDREYRRWRQRQERLEGRKKATPLTDAQLETAIMNIAGMYPGHVSRGVIAP